MDLSDNSNVIYLHLHRRERERRSWPTYCLDCDPAGERPFDLPVHKDVRTGDILTPCPSCKRIALVDAPRADERFSKAGTRPVSR
jgi:hypothetical protein